MKRMNFKVNACALAMGVLLSLSCAVAPAQPVAPVAPVELPDAEQAATAIGQDPGVAQARAALEAAGHGATMLSAGPYEWTVGGTAQRRRVDGNGNSNEWNVALERPIRIGGKAELDQKLGQSSLDMARAQLSVARTTAARTLLDSWLDWQAASQARAALDDQLRIAEENQRTVELRQRAGDASRLDANVAQGDLAEARRQAAEARINEAKAAESLRLRYPTLPLRAAPLPDPTLFEAGDAAWRERMIADHPLLIAAAQNLRTSELRAERLRAERTPDPTVGVFMASEARRTERIVGISFSIPLGGTYRQAAALEALRQVDVARAGLEGQRRELELQVSAQLQDVAGSVERWRLAEQAATALRETARLSQRAYTAGELDVQALLLVRRQALSAATAAQDARAAALRARYRLLLDAGSLWPQGPV